MRTVPARPRPASSPKTQPQRRPGQEALRPGVLDRSLGLHRAGRRHQLERQALGADDRHAVENRDLVGGQVEHLVHVVGEPGPGAR